MYAEDEVSEEQVNKIIGKELLCLGAIIILLAVGLYVGYYFSMQENVESTMRTWCENSNNVQTCCSACERGELVGDMCGGLEWEKKANY